MNTRTQSLLVAALPESSRSRRPLRQDQNTVPDDGDKKPCWGVNKCKGPATAAPTAAASPAATAPTRARARAFCASTRTRA